MSDEPRKLSPNAVHLVRTATQANLALSQMADQKASILIGATFVVFTLAIGQSRGGPVPLALLVLAGFAFLSALCAVAAVLPSISAKTPPGSQTNLLFFANFAALEESEFADRVLDELADDEKLFRTMLRDIHQNGRVLQFKKYRFLRLAYLFFLGGLICTFAIFLLETCGVLGAVGA